jgi:PAS domain-containing protein
MHAHGRRLADLFLAMARDVTLRNRTFRELQQAHRHLRSIIDASDSFIWLCDADSRFLLMNERLARPARRYPAISFGRVRSEVVPAANVTEHEANDRAVLESGQPLTVEEHLQAEDGEHIASVRQVPVRDTEGQDLCGRRHRDRRHAAARGRDRDRGVRAQVPAAVRG